MSDGLVLESIVRVAGDSDLNDGPYGWRGALGLVPIISPVR